MLNQNTQIPVALRPYVDKTNPKSKPIIGFTNALPKNSALKPSVSDHFFSSNGRTPSNSFFAANSNKPAKTVATLPRLNMPKLL